MLATSAVNSDGDSTRDATGDLTTPSTAMGTTSESTSADPAGESTSQSPAINDVTTMDAAADTGDTRRSHPLHYEQERQGRRLLTAS